TGGISALFAPREGRAVFRKILGVRGTVIPDGDFAPRCAGERYEAPFSASWAVAFERASSRRALQPEFCTRFRPRFVHSARRLREPPRRALRAEAENPRGT